MVGGEMMKILNNDKVFTVLNYILATLFLVVTLYPLWYVIICSFSTSSAIAAGKVILLPHSFTIKSYEQMLNESQLWIGYANSIFYTVAGTCVNLLCTIPAAYALSRPGLPFKRQINFYFLVTMFISAGLIPTYLLVSRLGLVNNRAVLIILGAVSVPNMIICRTFFQSSIPEELIDAARIDGGSDIGIFARVVLPLSKPIVAVMVLYFAVGHWNSYFNGMVYMRDSAKYPLQLVLRFILLAERMLVNNAEVDQWMDRMMALETMKYAVVIVASLPVLVLYPFIQKYFVKGVMLGSVKG